MRKVALGAAVFVAAVISFGSSQKIHAQSSPEPQQKKTKQKVVVVRSGDSLSKIAQKNKTTYTRLFYANSNVKHPDLIYPDQKLRVPKQQEKLIARPMPANAQVPANQLTRQSAAQRNVRSRSSYGGNGLSNVRLYDSPQPAPVASAGGDTWDRLAACESGGNWAINTGNGYYGGLQFSLSSWRGVGGQGLPHQASKAEQIRRAEILRANGGWGHWPACSAKLGLR